MNTAPQKSFPHRREPSPELDELARKVIGALIEVHRKLGPGFLENVYEEAACIEFAKQGIPYARQVKVTVEYDGKVIGEGRIDLLVDKKIIIEIKAVDTLAPIHQAQIMSYLRMTGLELGLLVNFNVPILKYGIKRIIWTL
jgi:GxxExxY protein